MLKLKDIQPAKHFTTANPPSCSCPGWRWRQDCRHVRELRAALALIESVKAKWESE